VTPFEKFIARKTAEAQSADIAPFGAVRDGADASFTAVGNEWTRRMFDGAFYLSPARDDGIPSTSLVFVRSCEGNTVSSNPEELGGGKADKHLIYEGLSRVAADAVLAGAATMRGGNLVHSVWRRELVELRVALGLPRHPIQAVATLEGAPLEQGFLFNVPELPVIVLTVPHGAEAMRSALAARPWITPIVMDTPHDLPVALRRMSDRGIERVSCIGGRTLAGQLIDADLIQDLYLTTTPRSAGEPNTPFYAKPLSGREVVRKRGTGLDEGVVFQHIAIGRSVRP
jgi:5-amino-6-(5-phosphoribosylamino)uracil reductase